MILKFSSRACLSFGRRIRFIGVLKRRIRVKEIMKAAGSDKTLNARQQALKTIANSM